MVGLELRGVARHSAWPLLVVTVLGLATAFQTLPSPAHWGDRFGTNVGDPVYVMWVLASQVHHPLSPLQGNIFLGHDNTVAYSDSMLPYQLVFFPVYRLTGDNPIAGYNAVLFTGYLAGGLGVYALALRFVRDRPAALVAALLFSVAPYRSASSGHLQLVGVCFLILAFLFLVRFLEDRRLLDAGLYGVMAGLTWLGSLYCFMMLVVTTAAVVVVWCLKNRHHLDGVLLRGAGLAGLSALAFIAPTLPAYISVERTGAITRDVTGLITVRPRSFSMLPGGRLYNLFGLGGDSQDFFALYPGLLLGMAALAGAAVLLMRLLRSRRGIRPVEAVSTEPARTAPTRVTPTMLAFLPAFLAAVVLCGFVMIGPNHTILLSLPDKAMRKLIPGMANLRDLTRFWLVFLIVFALLAAQGVATVTRRLRADRAALAVIGVSLLAGFELVYGHAMATVAYDGPPALVNDALAGLPSGPVVELPLPPDNTLEYAFTVAPRQLRSVKDGDVRVEGYSGAIPTDTSLLLNAARLLPDPTALALLRQAGLRYVVVHAGPARCSGELAPDEATALVGHLRVTADQVDRVVSAGADRVVVLRPAPANASLHEGLAALPAAPLVLDPLCVPGALGG